MKLDNDKKEVLIAALQERYKAMHIIRGRVQAIGVWSLGFLLGASGWLIQSNLPPTLPQKVIFSLVVLVAFYVLRCVYLKDLNRGFQGQQHVAVRLEKALNLYTPGIYDDSHEPIFPKEWARAGTKEGQGNYFVSSYVLIYTGVCILIISILLKGCVF